MSTAISFPSLLQQFFTDRLIKQRQASPHTIASYRDTFRLLLRFAQSRLGRSPDRFEFDQIDAPLIGAFLDDLEKNRHIAARTRNLRLTAIRSFFRYTAFEAPAQADQIQRVLAMPPKRWTRAHIAFLTRPEIDALLSAPHQQTWSGRRDHALILVAVQTGLRLSEITGLQRKDVNLDTGANVRVIGKGRKERVTPLTKNTVGVLRPRATLPPSPRAARRSRICAAPPPNTSSGGQRRPTWCGPIPGCVRSTMTARPIRRP